VRDDAGTTRRHKGGPLGRVTPPTVRILSSPAEVARAGARLCVELAWQAIALHDEFSVALAGGNTPRETYRLLAGSEFGEQVDWSKVQVFWSDERAVPPDHAESNYGMARRELLLHVPIPPANVHRMEANRPHLGRAAQDYEDVIRRHIPLNARGFPRFDLILLGMGADGHTASLFPGAHRINETSRWVSTPMVTKLKSRRMTLTLPVLNAAEYVLFLVCGPEKASILHEVLEGTNDPPLPAQMVTVPEGHRAILADEAAGALLDKHWRSREPRVRQPEGTR
jgi:6-phosphogluconolactonase